MVDSRIKLVIKFNSLAEESRIIRRRENKTKMVTCPVCDGQPFTHLRTCQYSEFSHTITRYPGMEIASCKHCKKCKGSGKIGQYHPLRMELKLHRKGTVRVESRATQWALAFLRGRELSEIETSTPPYYVYAEGKYVDLFDKARKMVENYGVRPQRLDGESQAEFNARKKAEEAEELSRFNAWAVRAKGK